MKYLPLALVVLLSACKPAPPHIGYVCTSVQTDLQPIPMAMPDGRGGVTMQMQWMPVDTCTGGYYACTYNGQQVDESHCQKPS